MEEQLFLLGENDLSQNFQNSLMRKKNQLQRESTSKLLSTLSKKQLFIFLSLHPPTILEYIFKMATDQPTYEQFEFLQESHSKHLNCKMCSQLMLDPIRLHRCGHTLCKECTDKKNVKKCPICLQSIKAKQKDILASRLVGQLGVKCLHEGCPWKGTLMEFRSFHKEGCKLKQGGIDQWLKRLEESINVSRKPEEIQKNPSERGSQENEKGQNNEQKEKEQQRFVEREQQQQEKQKNNQKRQDGQSMNGKLQKQSTKNSNNSAKKTNSQKTLRSTQKKFKKSKEEIQDMIVVKNFRTDLDPNQG